MAFDWYILFAAALAALVPLALIATRTELRKVRRRIIRDIRCLIFKGEELPQLTLVEARYVDDSNAAQATAGRFVGSGRQSQIKIWTGALVFFLVCLAGFALLLTPRQWLLSETPDFPSLTYALLWTTERAVTAELAQAVTIAGAAFLGGYIFQIRYLIRTTLNQELSALAFVRASVHIIQGVIIAIVAFRVVSVSFGMDCETANLCPPLPMDGGGAQAQPHSSTGFALALGLAFVIGYWPDLGLNRIGKALRVRVKSVDPEALRDSVIIPLEIIDGIDAETAFRLQENNLYDVQNLATSNPIQLYVETPFGMLEILDWVLQAQLCENVGPRTFVDLKSIGIRTVFDLERAALACNAPKDYVAWLGTILFRHGEEKVGSRFGAPPPAAGAPSAITAEHVRHAVAVILDDLHIHQLRALWRIMLKKTMHDDQRWLHPTGPLPGEPDLPACA